MLELRSLQRERASSRQSSRCQGKHTEKKAKASASRTFRRSKKNVRLSLSFHKCQDEEAALRMCPSQDQHQPQSFITFAFFFPFTFEVVLTPLFFGAFNDGHTVSVSFLLIIARSARRAEITLSSIGASQKKKRRFAQTHASPTLSKRRLFLLVHVSHRAAPAKMRPVRASHTLYSRRRLRGTKSERGRVVMRESERINKRR